LSNVPAQSGAANPASGSAQQQTVAPLALLRGVEAVRLGVRSGKLDLQWRYRNGAGEDTRDIAVWFDGVRRRFDVEKATGATTDLRRVMFDGNRVVRFDGHRNADITELYKQIPGIMFDPRLLGITTDYSWFQTLDRALCCSNAKSMSLVGEETIDAVSTWHVRCINPHDFQLDFWIEQSGDFAVRRSECRLGNRHSVTTAKYGVSGTDRQFPTEVHTVEYRGPARGAECDIIITHAAFDLRADQNTFTLTGLKLPIGTSVNDLKIHRRIGYWDGRDVVEQPPALRNGDHRINTDVQAPAHSKTFVLLLVNGLLLGSMIIVFVVRYVRSH
jgi:hypothetical protein